MPTLDYAKHKLKCHGDFYTFSQGFVCINILLFNQLAEFWVAYFRVAYFPAIMLRDTAVPFFVRAWHKVCVCVCVCRKVHAFEACVKRTCAVFFLVRRQLFSHDLRFMPSKHASSACFEPFVCRRIFSDRDGDGSASDSRSENSRSKSPRVEKFEGFPVTGGLHPPRMRPVHDRGIRISEGLTQADS